ncbi:MAG: glycosyltransferase [Patescibacteria group bacterium]
MQKTMTNNAVIYVNFSQYDNTGRILDYLTERFTYVLHFSFDHLRLKNGRKTNLITLYQKGHKPKQNTLYSLRTPPYLLFLSLPLVGILMIFQTIKHSVLFKKTIGPSVFFTVNAFPAMIGIILRTMHIVTHVHYWVWDYFPVKGPDWTLQIIRYTYLIFDMIALRLSDKLIFPNLRQLRLRKSLHGIKGDHAIIPLGCSKPILYSSKQKNVIGFLGMLKSSQGLDLILSCFDQVLKHNPNIRLEIIGSGPEEEYFRMKAKKYGNKINFYGFIENQNMINRIVHRWFAGLAPYKPIMGNESYFGDPSKIKVYLSQGVPIITTNVTEYGALAKKNKFGITIVYTNKELLKAIQTLYKQQRTYQKNALRFASSLYYKNLYKTLFRFP